MPTAAEFRLAAQTIDDLSGELKTRGSSAANIRDGLAVTGGRLSELLDEALSNAKANFDSLGVAAESLADDLRERAAACDAFSIKMRIWRIEDANYWAAVTRGMAVGDSPPTRPSPAEIWIEEG